MRIAAIEDRQLRPCSYVGIAFAGLLAVGQHRRPGDALDAAAVDAAVAGQDAVIDALGGKTPWKVTTRETSAAVSSAITTW
jgi:hypothetical protein